MPRFYSGRTAVRAWFFGITCKPVAEDWRSTRQSHGTEKDRLPVIPAAGHTNVFWASCWYEATAPDHPGLQSFAINARQPLK